MDGKFRPRNARNCEGKFHGRREGISAQGGIRNVGKSKVVLGLICGRPLLGNIPTLMEVYMVKGKKILE
jgi:hypothetical protein